MIAGRFAAQAARSAPSWTPMTSRVPARSYAQAVSGASTRPPIALYGVDGTYASALYTAAAKSSSLDPTARAIAALESVFKRDSKLQQLLQAPALSASDKQGIVAELAKHTGGQQAPDTVKNFLSTLAENNRLGVLESVTEKFGQLMSAARGEVEMIVTSAAPLEQRTLKQLETAIAKSKYVSQGQKLKVVPKVDPEIRGGLIVEIGDRTIDLSVSAKMARLNKLLKDTL